MNKNNFLFVNHFENIDFFDAEFCVVGNVTHHTIVNAIFKWA